MGGYKLFCMDKRMSAVKNCKKMLNNKKLSNPIVSLHKLLYGGVQMSVNYSEFYNSLISSLEEQNAAFQNQLILNPVENIPNPRIQRFNLQIDNLSPKTSTKYIKRGVVF